MTIEAYLQTPESVRPQELFYGEWRVADSPTPAHQETVAALFMALHDHLLTHRVGNVWFAPLDVILDEARSVVVQPDLFVIVNDSAAIVADRVRGAPDLVIEVLSPRPRIGELAERIELFREFGVRECWFVHQLERRAEVLQFSEGTTRRREYRENDAIESVVLPAFTASLGSILGY